MEYILLGIVILFGLLLLYYRKNQKNSGYITNEDVIKRKFNPKGKKLYFETKEQIQKICTDDPKVEFISFENFFKQFNKEALEEFSLEEKLRFWKWGHAINCLSQNKMSVEFNNKS